MDPQKDLEALRKAVEDATSQINTLLLSRAALGVLLAVLLIRALVAWGTDPVQGHFKQLRDDVANHPSLVSSPVRLDPLSLLFQTPEAIINEERYSPEDLQLARTINQEGSQLRNEYWSIFGVSFSILGTNVQFDLRVILLTIPLFGPVANIYLAALRYKRRSLIAIGRSRLDTAPLFIDCVFFQGPAGRLKTWVLECPASILNIAFWVSVATVVAVCTVFEAYQASADDRGFGLILLNVTIAAFVVARHWSRNIETNIARETLAQTGVQVPPDPANALITRYRLALDRWLRRLRPKPAVMAGSFLILLTLFLTVGDAGCSTVKGYYIVKGETKDHTSVSYAMTGLELVPPGWLSRWGYIATVTLALALLVLAPSKIGAIGSSRAVLLAAAMPLPFVFSLTIHAGEFLDLGGWKIYWAIFSVVYLLRLWAIRKGRRPVASAVSMVISTCEVLIVPLICTLVGETRPYPGLPVMTAGIVLVTAGAYSWSGIAIREKDLFPPAGPAGASIRDAT